MADNYAAEGKPERAVNYFHRGPSSASGAIDEKVAAGWLKDVCFDAHAASPERNAGPGLYALISWTERARGYILKDELRYLSPEFSLKSVSKRSGKPQGAQLLGAALLNDPFLTELPRVAASETPESALDKKLLLAAFGLADDATDEQVNEAAKAHAEKSAAAAVALAEVTTKAAEGDALKAKLAEVEGQASKLSEKVKALESEKRASEVTRFFDDLVRAGKCTPAYRAGMEPMALAQGLEAFKFLEGCAPIVPQGEVGVAGDAGASDAKAEASKKFNAHVEALRATGLTFTEAHNRAKRELPKEFALYFAAK
jgi:phage I-like protein